MQATIGLIQPDENVVDLHTAFYGDYLGQFGIWDFNVSGKTLGNPERSEGVTSMTRPVLQALKANFFAAEGNFLAASSLLMDAEHQAQTRFFRNPTENKADFLAYVLFEQGVYANRLENYDAAADYFERAYELADDGPLKIIADFELQALGVTPRRKAAYAKLEQRVIDLTEFGLTAYTALAMLRLGTFADQAEQYKAATAYYKRALDLCKDRGYDFIGWQIQNAQGYSAILQNQADQARGILDKIANNCPSHSLKSLALENLALVSFNQKDYPTSASYVERALEICRQNQVVSRLAPECQFLGDLYKEFLGEPEKAGYFYRLGFEQIANFGNAGIPISGNRLGAMEAYVSFLQDRGTQSQSYLPHESHFEFALGKTWRDIMDLFHYNLIIFHFSHTGRGETLIKHLEMPATTFYSLKDRLSKRGFKFPRKRDKDYKFNPDHYQDGMQRYLQFQADKPWKAINKIFEKDMMEFLYASYGYKKTRLSEILDLSYPMVIAKTKAVTDEDNQYAEYKRD